MKKKQGNLVIRFSKFEKFYSHATLLRPFKFTAASTFNFKLFHIYLLYQKKFQL